MNYTTVIFDFFGVFAPDVYPNWLNTRIPAWTAERAYYNQLALDADEGRLTKNQLFEALAEKSGLPAAQVDKELNAFPINQQMADLLQSVSKSYKTALICNASSAIIAPILKASGLTEFFNEIVFSSDVEVAKPEPRIYQLTLERLGVPGEEAVFIDDRAENVDGADSVGITGILYEDFPKLQAKLVGLGIAISQ